MAALRSRSVPWEILARSAPSEPPPETPEGDPEPQNPRASSGTAARGEQPLSARQDRSAFISFRLMLRLQDSEGSRREDNCVPRRHRKILTTHHNLRRCDERESPTKRATRAPENKS